MIQMQATNRRPCIIGLLAFLCVCGFNFIKGKKMQKIARNSNSGLSKQKRRKSFNDIFD